jgi:hypothetical protein
MASLTHISIVTRKTIRYGIYSVIAIILLRVVILTGVKIYRHFFPEPPPPPTVAYGKLPPLPFPQVTRPGGITFTLETPEGALPKFSGQAKVFFMPKISTQLLSLDTAKQKASLLGFSPDGAEVTETVYKFNHPKAPAELQLSIVSGVFSISYNLVTDPSPLEKRPIAPEVAASKVRSFLSSANVLPEDLTGATKSEYVKIQDQKIVSAISLSDANFVKVNFFRKDYEKFPSLTPEPNKGNVWFIVSGASEKEKMIVAGEYHYFPVDETNSSTYHIKTSQEAWDELSKGGGFIASLGDNKEGQNIKIRRVYLAYYDSGVAMDFYQPIIVFEGDRSFVAYVPAVTSDYYGQ